MRVTAFLILVLSAGQMLPAQPVVRLEANTDRGFYREGARSEIYVEARVRLETPAEDVTPAAGRNIAFVVDRSGSMAGEPVQALRQALAGAIEMLAERDTFAVVAFGSEVETLIPAQRRDQASDLAAQLAALEPAGGAALYDALNQGAAQLRRYAGPGTINHLVLVTDGPPTKGPREFDDFFRLADVFAREAITLSTLGVGGDFDEDLLAGLARSGHGTFRYVDTAAKLPEVLAAEINPLSGAAAHDVELTIAFKPYFDAPESHGWDVANVSGDAVTFHFPHVFATRELTVLVSAAVAARSASGALSDAVEVRLRWQDRDGVAHETRQALPLRFLSEGAAIRDSANVSVYRTIAGKLISAGLQDAIEQLDEGDPRRVLRALRQVRGEARRLNFNLQDEVIATLVEPLDGYVTEVESRGLNERDRKILRSGLFNRFEIPTADPDDEK